MFHIRRIVLTCCWLWMCLDFTTAFSTAKRKNSFRFPKGSLDDVSFNRHQLEPTTTPSSLSVSFRDDTMDTVQNNNRQYLATCIPGLANVLSNELQELGAFAVETSGNSAVFFQGNLQMGLRALLWVRTAHRILEFVSNGFSIETRDDLYEELRRSVHVKDLMGDGQGGLLTLSVKAILNNRLPKDISHSHYTALTVKNAICDEIRDLRGDRPNVDVEDADVPLVCILRGNNNGESADFTLWRSLHSSSSLHKRGYRRGGVIHKAAMKESLAAGLLLMTDWKSMLQDEKQGVLTLVDPMCGSGSLVLEAAMMAADIAPGLMRIKCGVMGQQQIPPVLKWKHQDEDASAIWKALLLDATQRAQAGLQKLRDSERVTILANDIHDGALDILEQSLHAAGLSRVVQVQQQDCREFQLKKGSSENVLVVTNPPWGVRLSDEDHESWESLRVFLRENCPPDTQAWVLSGNKSATKHLGLKRSQSMVLRTANQDLRWIQYVIRGRSAAQPDAEVSTTQRQRTTSGSPTYQRYRPNSESKNGKDASRAQTRNRPNNGYDRERTQSYRPTEKKSKHQTVPNRGGKTNEQIQQEEKEDSWY